MALAITGTKPPFIERGVAKFLLFSVEQISEFGERTRRQLWQDADLWQDASARMRDFYGLYLRPLSEAVLLASFHWLV